MMQKIPFIQDANEVEHIAGITSAFPYTMHRRDLTTDVIPWHWHEEVEFNYAYQGSIEIQTFDHTYRIKQGEAYFINTNVMDKKQKAAGSSKTVEHAHLFHPILLGGYFNSTFYTKYLNPVLKNRSVEVLVIRESNPTGKKFITLLHQLTELADQPDKEFEIRNLLSQAWLTLIAEIKFQEQHQQLTVSPRERSKNILAYLHKHYAEKVTINDIATAVNVSPKECIRSFKKSIHQTPIEYLLNYRIEQAKKLLRQSEFSITDVALQAGFSTSAYFSKIFKERVGQIPREYRQQQDKTINS